MAPHEDEEDLVDDEPPAIEPYKVLGINKTATADEIKSAYRKAALRHHPDKAAEHLKDEAHTKFQEIAFAYAVLSDPQRRKRYDATGSTSESIDFDDFSWSDFYREQFSDVISSEAIGRFAASYKGSPEEKDDVLNAYRTAKGKWAGIYEVVMLSDPLEDEERFRAIIDEGIEKGEIKALKAYTEESEAAREKRMRKARGEAEEAMAYAEELGVKEKLFGTKSKSSGKGKGKENDEAGLAALILGRQAGRASFLDQLEQKYANEEKKGKKGKRGKKRASEEEEDDDAGMPSEEAFQAAAAKLKNGAGEGSGGRKAKKTKH